MAEELLLDTPYWRASLDRRRRILRVARTSRAVTTPEESRQMLRSAIDGLAGLDRSTLSILSDVREAPGRNEPAFERAFTELREQLFGGFVRVAVLLRTAAGRLQIQRLSRVGGLDVRIFDDEEAALRYLESGEA